MKFAKFTSKSHANNFAAEISLGVDNSLVFDIVYGNRS